jgi:hypothetical protein
MDLVGGAVPARDRPDIFCLRQFGDGPLLLTSACSMSQPVEEWLAAGKAVDLVGGQ